MLIACSETVDWGEIEDNEVYDRGAGRKCN